MEIDRIEIAADLRARGLDARADWVEHTLPSAVDIDLNAGLLRTLGIDPTDARFSRRNSQPSPG